MLFPKKVKHRKWQSARSSLEKAARPETKGINVDFGSFGLKAQTDKRITSNQIEAARRAMVRYGGKTAKFWIRVFPDKSVTKKPAETRMGSGKGDVDHWVAVVKPGRILYEFIGVNDEEARRVTNLVSAKLPIKIKLVSRSEQEAV